MMDAQKWLTLCVADMGQARYVYQHNTKLCMHMLHSKMAPACEGHSPEGSCRTTLDARVPTMRNVHTSMPGW